MLYSRDEEFDLDAWQHSLASPRGGADKLNIDVVFDLLPLTGSIPKAVVIERLRDKGIGEKRSRDFISANLAPLGGRCTSGISSDLGSGTRFTSR
jgi:hypothetical protein